jgi:hypothetical protein
VDRRVFQAQHHRLSGVDGTVYQAQDGVYQAQASSIKALKILT